MSKASRTPAVCRRTLTALAATALTVVGIGTTSSSAYADEPSTKQTVAAYCSGAGLDVDEVLAEEGAAAALDAMSKNYYDDWIAKFDTVAKKLGLSTQQLCTAAWWLIEQGAENLVLGALSNALNLDPVGKDAKLAKQIIDAYELVSSLPSGYSIPEVGSNGSSAIQATVSWTNGMGVTMRTGPGTAYSATGVIPEAANVQILCQVAGEHVGSPGTNLWSYVAYDGQTAYVTDNYLQSYSGTSTAQVAPNC